MTTRSSTRTIVVLGVGGSFNMKVTLGLCENKFVIEKGT